MFRPPQLTADGALVSLEAMAGELRIEAHERHLHDHLNSILDDRHKGAHVLHSTQAQCITIRTGLYL